MKKIAVVLSGCGYLDGAEIRESVLTLLALDTEQVTYSIFAPDQQQHHTVNHFTQDVNALESRNVLQEASRIARGKILPLTELDSTLFDALIIPGGFGVAKNLSNFAFHGADGQVNTHMVEILKSFQSSKKPIGAICIAPVLLALVFGHLNPKITLGSAVNIAQEIEKTGAIHQVCETVSCVADEEQLFVTTPAYMDDEANLTDVFQGIHLLVKNVLSLVS
ncbi:isoprenoid biosynthesis glyoxalase ElbB [Acinetobacter rathckeae]|uniref:isoprenoid biosynthesis glyoxalase ElbB n=1 Tax=Acinetobacter rathckeae TaxID=2605272 RepID=UPI0018A32702|nr:isoprenoid biosynthesis glyoxalase ElbB [Acinetobacter rathckeae]MBF7695353.1 isoprenoid biosynthesis glyoxalase ElbB [Acinetobacter rathckeae]